MDGGPMYRWEQGINATWETVQEDEQGNLMGVATTDRERLHRNRQQKHLSQSIRRGIIRYLVVALDCSASALENDYRPSRLEATSGAVQKFVVDYYDQNPISQLAIILTRDRTAEKCSDLSGNARTHIDHLRKVHHAHDLASLESCILLTMKLLRHIPNYGHRELLIVFNSLSSCDAGDIFQTVQKARQVKLRISVICTSAEIFICRQLAELTGGSFNVALDGFHLAELLQKHTVPPADLSSPDALIPKHTEFIRMGFPRLSFSDHRLLGYEGKHLGRFAVGYHCPRCYTRASDIPTKCTVCQLQLNSSSHIARSFHHLFPVPAYVEYQVKYLSRSALSFPSIKQEEASSPEQSSIFVKVEAGIINSNGATVSEKYQLLAPDLPEMVYVAQRVSVDIETYYTDDEDEEEKEKAEEKTSGDKDDDVKVDVKPVILDTSSAKRRRLVNNTNPAAIVSSQIVLCPNSREVQLQAMNQLAKSDGISFHASHCYGCASLLHPNYFPSKTSLTSSSSRDSSVTVNTDKILFQCSRCLHLFCIDCDIFIHDVLHNCPGCPF